MLKVWVLLTLLILFTGCGKKDPVITGVEVPPNNDPVNTVQTPTSPAVSSPSGNTAPALPIHSFAAPAVATRADANQQNTAMSAAPGT